MCSTNTKNGNRPTISWLYAPSVVLITLYRTRPKIFFGDIATKIFKILLSKRIDKKIEQLPRDSAIAGAFAVSAVLSPCKNRRRQNTG